ARFEVLALNGLLRRLNAAGDELRFDGNAFFHAEALQEVRDPLLGEDTHQIVFEREEEARCAGIALTSGAAPQLVVDTAGLVPFRADDDEAAGGDYVLTIFRGLRGVDAIDLLPVSFRGFKFLSLVIEAQHSGGGGWGNLAFGRADRAGAALFDQLLTSEEFGIAAQQNIGAAARHVGGDGDHAKVTGLGDDLGFALVEFGIQHDVPDILALENVREQLGLFNRRGADENRLLILMQARNLIGDGKIFFLGSAEHHVGIVGAPHGHVGGNDDNFQLVNFFKFGGFGIGGTGHAGKLFV